MYYTTDEIMRAEIADQLWLRWQIQPDGSLSITPHVGDQDLEIRTLDNRLIAWSTSCTSQQAFAFN